MKILILLGFLGMFYPPSNFSFPSMKYTPNQICYNKCKKEGYKEGTYEFEFIEYDYLNYACWCEESIYCNLLKINNLSCDNLIISKVNPETVFKGIIP